MATGSNEEEGAVGAYRGFVVVMLLAMVMMRPSPAAAQLPSAGAPGGNIPIAIGQRVTVTTADGRKVKGQVLGLSPTTLDIGKGDVLSTSLGITDVLRVQVADSVTNGVIIGALSLGLVGAAYGLFGDATTDLVSIIGTGKSAGTDYTLIGTLAGAGLGALVGYALDAGKEKTVYERGTVGMSVAVRPIVSNAGKGVGVSVRW